MDKPTRIAVMVRRLSGRGGMERVIRTVADAARHATPPVTVEVWCFGIPQDDAWLSRLPYRVVNIDQGTGRRFQLGTKLPLYTRAARRFMRESAVDVCLATDPVFVRAAQAARGRNASPRVFSWLHFALDRVANRQWLASSDGHLAISTQIADAIRALGAANDPVTVGNPLPASDFPLIPRPDGPARVLYIGRLQNHQKRVDLLMTALGGLREEEFSCDIIGDGPDRPLLEQMAKEAGIADRVVLHGWALDPWSRVESATVLVLPSDFEGFPMVLLEALAHGLPIVATDCNAGPRDVVIPGSNGFLTPTGDAGALKATLRPFLGGRSGALPLAWSARERQEDVLRRFSEPVVWARMVDAFTR